MKKNFLRLFVPVFSGLLLCGCTASDGVSSEALSTPNEIYINAEAQTEEERIARLDLGGSVLPVLPDVTTAEDNSVLAPSLLRKGDQNPVVMQLQERLMSLGYMDNDEPTDFYGDATSVAVMHFQRQNGLTQEKFCEKIGIEPSSLSNIETGKSFPSMGTILTIMEKFGITPESFF